jgi:hypothetical protein
MTGCSDGVLSDARIAAMSPAERRDLISGCSVRWKKCIHRWWHIACDGIG